MTIYRWMAVVRHNVFAFLTFCLVVHNVNGLTETTLIGNSRQSTTAYMSCTNNETIHVDKFEWQTIFSPGNPTSSNAPCMWKLVTDNNNNIEVKISSVDACNNCECENVHILDGGDEIVQLICEGTELPETYTSKTNILTIYIHQESRMLDIWIKYRKVFQDISTTVSPSCNGEDIHLDATDSIQYIISPIYQGVDCKWTISSTSVNSTVEIDFLSLYIMADGLCHTDRIDIYDGSRYSNSTKMIARVCGNNILTGPIRSSMKTMSLEFISRRNNHSKAAFTLSYQQSVYLPENCHGVKILKASLDSKKMIFEKYPSNLNNLNCFWQIVGPEGSIVHAEVNYYNIQQGSTCKHDRLSFFGNTSIGPRTNIDRPLCGASNETAHIIASGNSMLAWFHTFESTLQAGFTIIYYAHGYHVCPRQHELKAGYFELSLYSSLHTDVQFGKLKCTWRISGKSDGNPVVIHVRQINLRVSVAYLVMYDGPSAQYQNFTVLHGDTIDTVPIYFSSGTDVSVYLQAEYYSPDLNIFYLTYYQASEKPTHCEVNIPASNRLVASTSTHYITSPNYPDDYNNDETVYWLIWRGRTDTLNLVFDVIDSMIGESNECFGDYVEVFNGDCIYANVKGKFCGNSTATYTITDTDYILIKFQAHFGNTPSRFKMSYRLDNEPVYSIHSNDDLAIILGSSAAIVVILVVLVVVACRIKKKKPLTNQGPEHGSQPPSYGSFPEYEVPPS